MAPRRAPSQVSRSRELELAAATSSSSSPCSPAWSARWATKPAPATRHVGERRPHHGQQLDRLTARTSTTPGSNGTVINAPNVDAIQEFTLARGNYDAGYGRSGGGQVVVATKSGTSAFHGTPTSSCATPRSTPTSGSTSAARLRMANPTRIPSTITTSTDSRSVARFSFPTFTTR